MDASPSVDARLQTGDVCLHVAANKARTEILGLLLEGGANVNVQNKLGQTALHCAAGYGAKPSGISAVLSDSALVPRSILALA